MGNYSWLRADKYTERSNIACGDTYKFLVPKEFGGGYVRDVYHGCGYIFDKN